MDATVIMSIIKDVLGANESKNTDNERIQDFMTALMNCPVNMTLDLRDIFREVSAIKEDNSSKQPTLRAVGNHKLKRKCISFSGSMYEEDWAAINKIISEVKRDTKKPVTRMSVYRAIIEVGIQHKDELEIDLK